MNQYPAKAMMDEMAKYGRYGDSMLVHMNPIEVAGIASLSPTGSLTTNPVTGQPEAFLPLLVPALGMIGGAAGLSTIATAALTGIGTAAITGDVKRGLLAGLTAGVAGGIGDLFASGAETVTSGVADAATAGADAATELATQQAIEGTSGTFEAGFDRALAGFGEYPTQGFDVASQLQSTQGALSSSGLGQDSIAQQVAASQANTEAMTGFNPATDQAGEMSFSGRVDEAVKGMSPMQATMLSAIGSGQLAEMDVQDELAAQRAAREAESEEKLNQAYNDLYRAQMAAQPGLRMGLSSGRSIMSRNTPIPRPTMGMAEGGATAPEDVPAEDTKPPKVTLANTPMEDIGFHGREEEVLRKAEMGTVLTPEEQAILERYYGRYEQQRQEREERFGAMNNQGPEIDYQAIANAGGGFFQYVPGGGIGLDPVSVQKGLRGEFSVAPPKDYMTGFEPEFTYFQNDPHAPFIPDRGYRPTEGGVASSGDYFDPILDREAYNQQLAEYYTMLGSYMPGEVEYPEESDSIPDDPDTVGDDPIGGGGDIPDVDPSDDDDDPLNPDDTYDPDVPDDGPYADRYDAWRRNSDYILDKVRRGVPLTDSEQNWYRKYEAGLIVDPRLRPEGFQVPASYEDAMALFESGGYEGITTVGFGTLDDFDRGDEEQYPRPPSSQKASSQKSSSVSAAADPRALKEQMAGIRALLGEAGIKGAMKGVASQATPQGDGPKGGIAAGPAYESDIIEPGKNIATIVRGSDAKYGDMSPEEREYMQEAYILKFQAQAQSGQSNPLTDDNYDYRRYLELGYPPLTEDDKDRIGVVEMQAGGEVPLRTPMGETSVPEGGIANMPTEFSASMPTEEEFNMVVSAIAGQAENADQIIEMFIQRYGVEMFTQLRDMILQSIVPNAQTEGMIQGSGGGMDDMVNGMIGAEQPVAVSPGEYIVPADVVSGIGDGSSDAGAQELDAMMARVRMARGGTTEQAPAIDAKRMMPA